MSGLLSRDRIIAPADYNRWRAPVASVAIHLCIGSVYAWSIYNPPLTKLFGVVASSGDDWSLSEVVWVFTVAIVFLGLAAAFAGKWLETVGPRKVGVVAAFCWGGGYIVGGFGIVTHQLWLLYLGYGVIGGCGLGLGYVSPVSTLIRWFPDRRGMAAGMAIMGFGGGAMIGTPMKEFFIRLFYQAPEFLGSVAEVDLVTQAGRRFVEVGGVLQEVVIAGAAEIRDMTLPGPEGVYVVNSGASGVAETFFVIGVIYLVVMLLASFSYRLPVPGWKPEGWEEPAVGQRNSLISDKHVDIDQALKTPQFYQLWVVLCLNVTAGIGVLGVARTMMTEIFGTTLPDIVDTAFAATYVVMISAFNMVGRFIWASASDYIGRRNTYWIFFLLGIILYLSVPFSAQQVSVNPSVVWLVYFYAATMIIFTMYGGGFATIPAYLADIFGTRYVGGIHGRLLTAWSTAGVLGPLAITSLRQNSVDNAISDLMTSIEPAAFLAQFGAPVGQLEVLVAQNSVTISRLMEIAPAGTTDPTSGLYNSTMVLMAALLGIALVSNALMKPVDTRHHMEK
jgi:MFS family permease